MRSNKAPEPTQENKSNGTDTIGSFRMLGAQESGKMETVESSEDAVLKYLAQVLVAEYLNQKRYERKQ